MSRSRWPERALLALLALVAVWQTYEVQRTRHALVRLQAKVDDQGLRLDAMESVQKIRAVRPPPPEVFQPQGGRQGRKAARRGGGAGAGDPSDAWTASADEGQQRIPEVPGSRVLNLLYDAADEMAQEEDWDGRTYDEVARVFERTTNEMVGLVEDFRSGDVKPVEARRRAVRVRDQAEGELQEILGDEGFARLRETIKEEMPPWAPRK